MENKRIKRVVNEIISLSHAEFISASSTYVVELWKQQRQALKILNQVQNDYFFKEKALNKDTFSHPLRSGFTLIELLVVVLIIGILASVALPQYQKAVWRSRYTQLMLTADSIARAEEIYYVENNAYTDELDTLDIQFPGQSGSTINGGKYSCLISIYYGEITCEFEGISPKIFGYHVYLNSGRGMAGKKYCYTARGDATSVYAQICKSLTGKDGTDGANGSSRRGFQF